MLEVRSVDAYYEDLQVLWSASLKVDRGKILALIGSNGAGKSTLLKAIMGLATLRSGEINFQGERIDKLPTHEIVKRGISLVPEGRRLFSLLTVEDNLLFGAYTCKEKKEKKSRLENIFQMFPKLKERRKQLAVTLSGGEQQMCAIGRALMSNPKLLLLDEPSTGLSPLIKDEVFESIRKINKEMTVTILLAEQDVYHALELADRCEVMDSGKITLSGTAEELLNSPSVRKAYLGI